MDEIRAGLQPVGVASFQVADLQDDYAAAIGVMRECAVDAANAGASFALFPECFLQGYTRDREVADSRAVDLGSPTFRTVLRALAGSVPVLVFGLIERFNGQLFNTAVVVSEGQLVGTYRKRHSEEGRFVAGCELPVFSERGLRFGVEICSDARDREDASRLAHEGVDVIFYPLNNLLPDDVAMRWRDRHVQILSERAVQTGAWVVSSDVVGSRHGNTGYGCSAAIDGRGALRAQAPQTITGMVIAHIPVGRNIESPAPAEARG